MKIVKIIENKDVIIIPVKIEIDKRIVDVELEYHKEYNDNCFDSCPLREICYRGNENLKYEDDDELYFKQIFITGNVGYNKDECNIGELCDNLADTIDADTDYVWPTPESMLKLNEVLGLVEIEDKQHILSPVDEKLKPTKQESKEDKYKSEILL